MAPGLLAGVVAGGPAAMGAIAAGTGLGIGVGGMTGGTISAVGSGAGALTFASAATGAGVGIFAARVGGRGGGGGGGDGCKKGPCEFYLAWCIDGAVNPKANKPVNDPTTYWNSTVGDCKSCYAECKASGDWPSRCSIADRADGPPRWPGPNDRWKPLWPGGE